MGQQARVTSLDAIESFRSRLIVYVSQARPALEEVSSDMVRVRSWLEMDQRMYWENQTRHRKKLLEQAQQALFSARLGNLRQESAAEVMAVHRAQRALEEAESKLRVLKRWRREFDGQVQPMVKQMEKLQTLLCQDMVQAVAHLTQTLNTLTAYAELRAPAVEGAGAAPSGAAAAASVPGAGEPSASAAAGGTNVPL